ncbi:MAG: hypothetical protein Q4C21_07440 [Oscillospiraceae bacterium]|nr:hypothetical protein [Oscillospiraceae bacterium]
MRCFYKPNPQNLLTLAPDILDINTDNCYDFILRVIRKGIK